MQELLPPAVQMEMTNTVTLRRDGILAFCEKPSATFVQKKEEPSSMSDEINASELFSLFTADIIKEKIVFTR